MTTEPTALLRRTEAYLSALHGSVARHDNLAANLACAGCELRDEIRAALAVLPDPTDRAAVLREAADRIDREDLPQDFVDVFDNGARWATKLLRRLAAEAPTTTKPETDLVEEYLWFLRGLGSEPDLSSLPPERRKVVTAQFEIIRTLADRDPELPPIERDPVARRLGLTGASEPAAGVRQDGAQPSCSAALLPFGTAPADRCVVEGKHVEHVTAEGRRWTVEEPQP